MTAKKPVILYHAVVREQGTLRELARYSYESRKEAETSVRQLREIRRLHNHERVYVTLEK